MQFFIIIKWRHFLLSHLDPISSSERLLHAMNKLVRLLITHGCFMTLVIELQLVHPYRSTWLAFNSVKKCKLFSSLSFLFIFLFILFYHCLFFFGFYLLLLCPTLCLKSILTLNDQLPQDFINNNIIRY